MPLKHYELKPRNLKAIQFDGTHESAEEIITLFPNSFEHILLNGKHLLVALNNDGVSTGRLVGRNDYIIKGNSTVGNCDYELWSADMFESKFQEVSESIEERVKRIVNN